MLPAKGRPLGMLVAWMLVEPLPLGRDAHLDPFCVNGIINEQRVLARASLRTYVNGILLLQCERRPRDGEPDEPLGIV